MDLTPKPQPETDATDRKRITDRRAQRNRRERIKAHIAHLEKTVSELTEASADRSDSGLLKKLEEKQLEITRLTDIIRQIHVLAGDSLASPSGGHAGRGRPPQRQIQPEVPTGGLASKAEPQPSQMHHVTLPSPYQRLVCGDGFENYFDIVNSSIAGVLGATDSIVSSAEDDDDLAIRAILHGWESAGAEYPGFDNGWKLLKALDQGLFYRAGPVERLAILRLMRSMLAWNRAASNHPERQIPSFMCPTPNLRDHLIVSGTAYVPEAAAAQFASEIQMHWSYEIRDACKYHTVKEKYQFSKEFNSAYYDINTWGVRADATLSSLLACGPVSIVDANAASSSLLDGVGSPLIGGDLY
ncbi:hypothetical protein FE257_010017 [Aspergillus nanangensis]|uniref:BZIP domain-containing protein n=1 Tax=Aspergillus nanangensis TaxID=2582783 RepID=A0AAD4GYC5_ASPNN|nr:hypothetical protein FE257_010017 [Aspergillus nanangensis]